MASPTNAPRAGVQDGPRLQRLLPPSGSQTVAQVVSDIGLQERAPSAAGRPRTLLNMVATVDGRATLAGRSGTISSPADRRMFHALRSAVDCVLVGAGTVRMERYGRMLRDESLRRERLERGLAAEPLAAIVSGRLELDAPLLEEPGARVAIVTSSAASLPERAARIDYVRAGRDGHLDLADALEQLARRFSIATILCEGGPHLAGQLFEAGLVDDVLLTLSPRIAGGEPIAGGEALRIVAGGELDPPVALELRSAACCDSYLFLRYEVSAPERVSAETTASSSLAR